MAAGPGRVFILAEAIDAGSLETHRSAVRGFKRSRGHRPAWPLVRIRWKPYPGVWYPFQRYSNALPAVVAVAFPSAPPLIHPPLSLMRDQLVVIGPYSSLLESGPAQHPDDACHLSGHHEASPWQPRQRQQRIKEPWIAPHGMFLHPRRTTLVSMLRAWPRSFCSRRL